MPVKFTNEKLAEAVAESESFAEVVRRLGAGKSGSTQTHIKRRIVSLGYDFSHFTHKKTSAEARKRKPAHEILVELPKGSPRARRKSLIRALYESGIPYLCAECGLSEWRGKQITLDIDHIDSNPLNCVLSNLRFLCPNCHAQTEGNYHSKSLNIYTLGSDGLAAVQRQDRLSKQYDECSCGGIKLKESRVCKECVKTLRQAPPPKIIWPPDVLLLQMVADRGYRGAARLLGVSDNAIRKHLKTG